tara:strand:+ start:614 stop:1372 length:759 start_codon:yes stop_codon:yes gene_type:complete
MAIKNKETLKNYFKKGGVVSEKHFIDLIDSSINVIDDGIDIDPNNGLKLNPIGIFSRIISFFRKKSQKSPDFTLNTNFDNKEGLSINGVSDNPIIKVTNKNRVGVNTNNPEYNLEVNGTLGVRSRIGTYSKGNVPADGVWHKIISNLDGINAFEVIAHASGSVNSGYYSISHVIVLSTFGGPHSKNSIKNYQNSNWNTFFGRLFNKKIIKFRWTGTLHDYNLEVKTSGDWNIDPETNQPYQIHYNVTKLLND